MVLSILDTDLYKFSVSNAYFQLYPLAEGTFKFNDRNKEDWRKYPEFLETMKLEIQKLANLSLTDAERDWCISHIPYIPANYWEWLQTFKFNPTLIEFGLDENGVFQCEVTDKLYKVTLYEIAVLSTYAEVRNRIIGAQANFNLSKALDILDEKIEFANNNNLTFAEFGARRRFSSDLHDNIVKHLKDKCHVCAGTSDVYLAMKYNMKPTGTYPHEWVMYHAGVFGYKRANYLSLEDWIKVYDGCLGTALLDTFSSKSFLRTLTHKQALLLDGYRQDSGDETIVGNMVIDRLKEFGIDPRTKLIVFSNALNFDKYRDIKRYFDGKIKVSAGIGTNITCDPGIDNYVPANIVMKLSKCRMSNKDPWEKCIKISDDLGKHMGDAKEFEIAKYELHLDDK